MRAVRPLLALAALSLSSACGASLHVTTAGNAFVTGDGDASFADGGDVDISRFVIALSAIEAFGADGAEGALSPTQKAFDLTSEGPHEVTTLSGLEGRRYEELTATVTTTSSDTENGGVDDDDFADLVAAGHAIVVAGTVEHDEVSKRFEWGFATRTQYIDCEAEDGSPGLTAPGEWEITVHGDRLFADRLGDDEPRLRTAAIVAADEDDDGDVTLAELAAVVLPVEYEVSAASGVVTLADFVTAATRGLVHENGNGTCSALQL